MFEAVNDGMKSHVTIRSSNDSPASATKPTTVFMHYTDRLSRTELQAATVRQLEQGGPFEAILALRRYLGRNEHSRFLEILESQHPNSSKAWLAVAAEYSSMNDKERARSSLRRAHWLAKFDPAASNQLVATKTLAKKLKMEDLLKEEISIELIREFGVTELIEGETTAPVEVGLDEPAFFFAIDATGTWHIVNWRIRAAGHNRRGPIFKVAFAHLTMGTSSWGSGRQLPTGKSDLAPLVLPDFGIATMAIEKMDEDKFQFIGRVDPK
jgi:hypothetical protein